jgi:putative zinc finger protein
VPGHPDHEQLAAYQAGDVDRRRRADVEAHLRGCPSCAEVVASVERARGRLAVLEEPELPPGLHDRLAAAVGAEAEVVGARPERPTPWYRRPAALAAAAALLLIAIAVPLLDLSGRDDSTLARAGGGSAQQEAAAPEAFGPGGVGLPVIKVPGEVSAAEVRSRLTRDPRAKLALERAMAARTSADQAPGRGPTQRETTGTQRNEATAPAAGSTAPPPAPPGGTTASPTVPQPGGTTGSPTAPTAAVADQQACLAAATAAADAAIQPLVPAFFVEGTYQGRQATVLVTTSPSRPGRTDLWVFPRGNCSGPLLNTARVR